MARITEDTLNDALTKFFRDHGFEVLPQPTTIEGRKPDHLIEYQGTKIISETEVGDLWGKIGKLSEAMKQLARYNDALGWNNLLAIIFPPSIRQDIFVTQAEEFVGQILDHAEIKAFYQIQYKETNVFEGKLADLISLLKEVIGRTYPEAEVDFETVVKALSTAIGELSMIMRNKNLGRYLAASSVGRFELFTSLLEVKKGEREYQAAILDLSSYILMNQIVFYKIFSEKTGMVRPLRELSPHFSLRELGAFLKGIGNINYKAIYQTDVLSVLPDEPEIRTAVKLMVDMAKNLQVERVKHDLLGRFFHDLLPHDTRKLLAAYYTRPQSAELLAALTIDRWDERVIDPACGSGTLLVSAYRRKKTLAPKTIHEDDIHKRFIADEVYGIDIMPFAAHLTALNLASQNIDLVTDETMTGVADSLFDIKGGYVRLSATKMGELFNYSIEKRTPNKKGDMEVRLYDFDTVIMNPPFTKKERIPAGYRSKIAKEWKDWGLEVGLWGPFLGVARMLARERGGKIGTVIPIALLRGRESARVRNNLIDESGNLRIRYIVKPVRNFAFSESSAYRDMLVVLENNAERTQTGIVFITADLRGITVEEAGWLGKRIREIPEGTDHEERDFSIYWVKHEEIVKMRENLMPLVSVVKVYNRKLFMDTIRKLSASSVMTPFTSEEFLEGYPPRPRGISRFIFITRPLDESRLKQAGLIIRKETSTGVEADVKATGKILSFPKEVLLPSLRTITGVRRMDISGQEDYLVIKECPSVREAALLSGFSGEIPWGKIRQEARAAKTRAVIARRMRWDSPSNSLIAVLSQKEFYPSNNLEVLRHTGEDVTMSVLFLNSVFFMLQLYYLGEATTENFVDVRIHDLVLIKRPLWTKVPKKAKEKLLGLWEEVKDYEFPCILDQLKNRDPARLKIDEAFAEILGVKVNLENLYDALTEEIEINRAFRKEDNPPSV